MTKYFCDEIESTDDYAFSWIKITEKNILQLEIFN